MLKKVQLEILLSKVLKQTETKSETKKNKEQKVELK